MTLNSSVVAAGDTVTATERNNLRKDIAIHANDYLIDSGAKNAYIATVDNQITSLVAGQIVKLKITNTNTGASTLEFKNSLSLDETKNIKNLDGTALNAGDLVANGIYFFGYDGTNFQLINRMLDMTLAESTNLTDGSDADTLHDHDVFKYFVGVGKIAGKGTKLDFSIPFAFPEAATYGWTVSAGGVWRGYSYGGISHTSASTIITSSAIFGYLTSGSWQAINWNYTYTKIIAEFQFSGDSACKTAGNVSFGFVASTAPLLDYDESSNSAVSFAIGAGDQKLYAHTCSASAGGHTEKELTGVNINVQHTYRIEYERGVSAKFYVDGVLMATITTDLPTTQNAGIFVGFGSPANSSIIMSKIDLHITY